MRSKALLNVSAAVITAIISALILYQTLFADSLLQEAGLVGIFFASVFSHLTVIGRGLFVPSFVQLTKEYPPLLLGFSAGLGAAMGEVTAYYWGLGIKQAFERNQKTSALSKWIEKYGLLAILLVAASPLPDTPIALLAGSASFPLGKFLVVQAIGKTLFYSLGAAVGGSVFWHLTNFLDELVLSSLVVAASVALCITASWSKSREWVLQFVKKILR